MRLRAIPREKFPTRTQHIGGRRIHRFDEAYQSIRCVLDFWDRVARRSQGKSQQVLPLRIVKAQAAR